MIYRAFFRSVLVRLDAERAHRLAGRAMRLLTTIPGVVVFIAWLLRPRDEALAVGPMGLRLKTPLGVAAGVDKNATWFPTLGALGFGFVEIGTITAEPQPGNPGKRVTRLTRDRAIVNAMGFPNDGAAVVAGRLAKHRREIVGVNIGKTMAVDIADAVPDYQDSARALASHADYLVINVSSPNTPGLTQMQSRESLTALVGSVRKTVQEMQCKVPILIKIGPDLTDSEVDEVADLALSLELDGIVAVNTTTQLELASASGEEIGCLPHRGGLSGAPLKTRALEVLERLNARTQGRLTLVSVGGIETPHDAWQRILAGASLLQAYTAFVYQGPLWPHRMNRGLSKCLRSSPWSTIEEAIGKGPES
ncbi:MAG TPA: quinone-dependent dihydroorotate dehydrogenase [Solirubrobacterales bacterium]|nr:quinone-dependent dihydroorotate dehydrogenase [Solirubrobacterales bacterium]